MRVLAVAVCASLLLGAVATVAEADYDGPGGCHKGIFWPFSRSKGDCLTDAEKKSGQTGVYGDPTAKVGAPAQNGPAQSAAAPAAAPNVAPAAQARIASSAPAAAPASSGGTFGGLFGSSKDPNPGLLSDNPAIANTGPAIASPLAPRPVAPLANTSVAASTPAPAPAPANTAAANSNVVVASAPPPAAPLRDDAIITRTDAAGVQCTKGIFWPFSRSKGDCLTDAEKKNGIKGAYLDPTAGSAPPARAVAAPAPVAVASIDTRPAASAPAPVAPLRDDAVITKTDTNGVKCTKGVFWPFSRSKGDCLTDAEKKNGLKGNYLDPTAGSAPPVRAVAAPAQPVAPATAAPARPAAAPVTVASIDARPAASAPAPAPATRDDAVITKTDTDGVRCTKGIFWPFSRSKGDCLTDAEKKDGVRGNYLDPTPGTAPAVTQTSSIPAPTPRAVAPAAVAAAPAVAPVTPRPVNAPVPTQAAANEPDLTSASTTPVVVASIDTRPAAPAPAAVNRDAVIVKTDTSGVKCSKGVFWPFSRSKGDCLTDAEKKNGLTGNYLDPTPGATPQVTPASTNAAARPAANSAPANDAVVTKADDNGGKCTKGIFWPFVRSAGDCQTDAEKKDAAAKGGVTQ